ncbi:hypothetical protein BU23DRAFT_594607 [Bimuria novae-zelandiae CBS 107.79]|uniref:Ubiquitin 3 binding protein But2 C-terminal domain-containing protein n=1 Tax=Bimuria novae-zelandiae CBS 107.79 TaxID=1447943 RepID=A0A6A5VTZ6_9PLEO|nr:hypothetical protein BU23DRAFT_594607 [Bimuria novae-zelandiae CBS 107.79]
MRPSTALFALAASSSTVLARPGAWQYTTDLEIIVSLSNADKGLGSRTGFLQGQRQEQPPDNSKGPFKTVNILVGKNVKNKDIRCKLIAPGGQTIKARRGEKNIDQTFGDGLKGEWAFLEDSEVESIICDPTFKKGDGSGNGGNDGGNAGGAANTVVRVVLSDQATETGVAFELDATKRDELTIKPSTIFSAIEIQAPDDVKDKLRCQIEDHAGKFIVAKRGKNVDTTFSDAKKGAWMFKDPERTKVAKITCDPAFVANPIGA